jgi:hypothetical protein
LPTGWARKPRGGDAPGYDRPRWADAARPVASAGLSQLEGSRRYTVDWRGWRRIVWDFNRDPAQGWVHGDGLVDGDAFHFDSFLITMDKAASTLGGTFLFDDLRAIPASPQPVEDRKPPASAHDTTGAKPDVVPPVLPDRWLRESRLQPRE